MDKSRIEEQLYEAEEHPSFYPLFSIAAAGTAAVYWLLWQIA